MKARSKLRSPVCSAPAPLQPPRIHIRHPTWYSLTQTCAHYSLFTQAVLWQSSVAHKSSVMSHIRRELAENLHRKSCLISLRIFWSSSLAYPTGASHRSRSCTPSANDADDARTTADVGRRPLRRLRRQSTPRHHPRPLLHHNTEGTGNVSNLEKRSGWSIIFKEYSCAPED